MTAQRAFFDTNVFVYAYDSSDPRKRDIARRLLLDHVGAGTLRTSTQALSEYFNVVTTRGAVRLGEPAAAWLIEQLPAAAVVWRGLDTVKAAVRRCAAGDLAIWDALIAEAARESGAAILYTEDRRLLEAVNGGPDGILAIDPFQERRESR
jgi:predicted nucleic acid-binding protein